MAAARDDEITTLSVFWEGTANSIDPPTTQVGLFAVACVGVDVSSNLSKEQAADTSIRRFKMAIDGCGVTHGTSGILFASGLRGQAGLVVEHIQTLLKHRGGDIVVNVLGLSRGGLGAIFLAQALKEHDSRIRLNVLLFDPVPGDQVFSGFPFTGMYGRDVSECGCLRRVLALYPHEPLPEIAFHAPVLCKYPPHTEVEEDVTLGCHQGALYGCKRNAGPNGWASNLSFRMIADFMLQVGTTFDFDTAFQYQPTDADCLETARRALAHKTSPTTRVLHDGLGLGRRIVRSPSGRFLNRFHRRLEQPGSLADDDTEDDPDDLPTFMLDIKSHSSLSVFCSPSGQR